MTNLFKTKIIKIQSIPTKVLLLISHQEETQKNRIYLKIQTNLMAWKIIQTVNFSWKIIWILTDWQAVNKVWKVVKRFKITRILVTINPVTKNKDIMNHVRHFIRILITTMKKIILIIMESVSIKVHQSTIGLKVRRIRQVALTVKSRF